MQCHKCPKSIMNGGTPDEECLTCKSADYLDNDFKTVIPIDDIAKVESAIESDYYSMYCSDDLENSDGDIIYFNENKTPKNLEDCQNALKFLKNCHHSSYKYIACILATFMAVGGSAPMLHAALEGKTMAEYATTIKTTRQNVSQMWHRLIAKMPFLKEIVAKSKKIRKRLYI